MIALLLLAPFLAGQTMAESTVSNINNNAFIPSTTPGCPDDWPICGTSGICYNPDLGQTCCPGGTYACPSGSFCLKDPYCCPNHQDPDTCAREYGVSLISSTGSGSDQDPPPIPLYPPPTLHPSSASSITISSTPIPTPTSSLIMPPPSSSPSSLSSSSPAGPAFTGAASWSARGVVGAAVVLGGLGVLGNLI